MAKKEEAAPEPNVFLKEVAIVKDQNFSAAIKNAATAVDREAADWRQANPLPKPPPEDKGQRFDGRIAILRPIYVEGSFIAYKDGTIRADGGEIEFKSMNGLDVMSAQANCEYDDHRITVYFQCDDPTIFRVEVMKKL